MTPDQKAKLILGQYGDLMMPTEAQEPILGDGVRGALLEWLTEIWAGLELEEAGLKPRTRAMFFGPPGTGKTTLAHHLSARLGLPMLAVRPDQVIDCWLGSTGKALAEIFTKALPHPKGCGPVVLFFDEFEALARRRQGGAKNAEREMSNVVSGLLQRIEQHDGIIIAATNLKDEIDPAIWRRFDIQIKLDIPGPRERELILGRYLRPYGLPPDQLSRLAAACETASPALMRQLCEGLKRNFVLGPRLGWPMAREQVFQRVLAAVQPPPEMGSPRLWALGLADHAVQGCTWPMPLATELDDLTDRTTASGKVVELGGRSA